MLEGLSLSEKCYHSQKHYSPIWRINVEEKSMGCPRVGLGSFFFPFQGKEYFTG